MVISTKWSINIIIAEEVITLLNLIFHIYQVAKNIKQGMIKVYYDNQKVVKDVNYLKLKVINYISDGEVAINEIDYLIQKIKIIVILEYRWMKKKRIEFKDDLAIYLLYEWNSESKRLWNKVERGEIQDSIPYFRMYYL